MINLKAQKAEADANYKKGKKALKTGLLKWSPDYLGASMYFESAGKLYAQIKEDLLAKESFIKYAEASAQTDSLGAAAEGYTQAAFLESDSEVSEQMLKKAQDLYMIDGKGEKGITNLRKFCERMLEDYEEAGEQAPEKLQRIKNLYTSLYNQLYIDPDYMLFNTDLVDEYMNLLASYDFFYDAIQARQKFIKYLKAENTYDHQMRRAYLELICLFILANEKFKLPECHKMDQILLIGTLFR